MRYAGILLLLLCTACNKEPLTTVTSFDDVLISFDNMGVGDTAIIFVPGWSNPRTIFRNQVLYFSKNYQVIAVDLPGFGQSGNNRKEWTMASYGKDLSMIIEQLNLHKVVVVGFSLGAAAALEVAKMEPDKVVGVVLVDEIQEIEETIPPPVAHYIDSVMMDLVNDPTKEKLLAGGFFKKNIDSSYQEVEAFLSNDSRVGWSESLGGFITWRNEFCIETVQDVNCPIIAINSDLQPTNVAAFRKYAPSFEAKIIEDTGHLIVWDQPQEFNRLLEASIQAFNK